MSRFVCPLLLLLAAHPVAAQQKPPTLEDLGFGAGGIWFAGVRTPPRPSLRGDLADAAIVLTGTLSNPRLPSGNVTNAVTDFRVDGVVKTHPALKGKPVLTLPHYIPVEDPKKPPRYLIFFDIHKGAIDPYRGIPLTSDAPIKYLREYLKLDTTKPQETFLFCLRHLDSKDSDVAGDALVGLGETSYSVLRAAGPRLPADKLAAALARPDLPEHLASPFAFVLGHTGQEKYAEVLKKRIEEDRKAEGLRDGLLIGYTLLRPQEGRVILDSIAHGVKESFANRYAALKALRFFWTQRPDVLRPAQVRDIVLVMLDQRDMADLVIEELRKHGQSQFLDRVLALDGRKEFDIPIMRRAVLRFALTFPNKPAATRFIEAARAKDQDFVQGVEEFLKLEKELNRKPGSNQ
jgi:hypothetical protein